MLLPVADMYFEKISSRTIKTKSVNTLISFIQISKLLSLLSKRVLTVSKTYSLWTYLSVLNLIFNINVFSYINLKFINIYTVVQIKYKYPQRHNLEPGHFYVLSLRNLWREHFAYALKICFALIWIPILFLCLLWFL